MEGVTNLTFNSILNEIQMSKLNYAAYITLKKSTQVDIQGNHLDPSPPLLTLLQQSNNELLSSRIEIAILTTSLKESKQKCVDYCLS